jgi:alpha-tubulin suppressor-like RCC1 family protein
MEHSDMKTFLSKLLVVGGGLFLALTGGAQPATKIAGGVNHSLFIKGDGSLWAMGGNNLGQLGDGSYNPTNLPEKIVARNVTGIASEWSHNLIIRKNGSLWAMGWNQYGQLGDGRTNNLNHPKQIVGGGVVAAGTGGGHSLFIKENGSLWAMGWNQYGQLGDGTFNDIHRPKRIVSSHVKAVAGGYEHSLFLKDDGSLWAMGDDTYGQLGDGASSRVNLPIEIMGSNVTAIAAGYYHSLFLKSDGSLWAMGNNDVGQLGNGYYLYNNGNRPGEIVTNGVKAIAAGGNFSLFLKDDGSLWGMGDNQYGELGVVTNSYAFGGVNPPIKIIASGVVAIAGGGNHILFIKDDGSLWAMGDNEFGQLVDGTSKWCTNQPEQIVVGPPGYNRLSSHLVNGGKVHLSLIGIAESKYVLERSSSLFPAKWIPQATNSSDVFGAMDFTNAPDPTTNNFWRIRSVP